MKRAITVSVAITLVAIAWGQIVSPGPPSPEVGPDGRVTFRLLAANAKDVQVMMQSPPNVPGTFPARVCRCARMRKASGA